jgi:hypothetical protein
MSAVGPLTSATAFVTYLWHYMLARLLYDDLVRPVAHGHVSRGLVLVLVAGAAFGLGRASARRA